MNIKRLYTFIAFICAIYTADAQRFVYDLDFLFYFDNREYHSDYSPSQTLIGTRLSPEIGVEFKESDSGCHRLMGGVHYWQPLSNNFRDARIMPTLYYQYRHRGFSLQFGMVPFSKMIAPLPYLIMSDSLRYTYPNIQGALLQHQSRWGYIEMQCDWRGLQSKTTREAFRLVIDGQFRYKILYAGGLVMLNHLANYAPTEPKTGVCDDFILNPLIGLNASSYTPLDSLTFHAGYIMGYENDRRANMSYLCHGAEIDFYLQWRFLGIRNTLYVGDNLFPLYPRQGNLLNLGMPFYQSNIYNRTDIFFYLIKKQFINCKFSWNLHYVKGHKLSHQQVVMVEFALDKLPTSRKKNEQTEIMEMKTHKKK